MRHCAQQGCSVIVEQGRCAQHKRPEWKPSYDNSPRVRGATLQRKRAALFAREPLCRLCAASGRVTPAVIRDHIVPLAEGGTDDDSNIQPICKDCDRVKSQAEARRGAKRARSA